MPNILKKVLICIGAWGLLAFVRMFVAVMFEEFIGDTFTMIPGLTIVAPAYYQAAIYWAMPIAIAALLLVAIVTPVGTTRRIAGFIAGLLAADWIYGGLFLPDVARMPVQAIFDAHHDRPMVYVVGWREFRPVMLVNVLCVAMAVSFMRRRAISISQSQGLLGEPPNPPTAPRAGSPAFLANLALGTSCICMLLLPFMPVHPANPTRRSGQIAVWLALELLSVVCGICAASDVKGRIAAGLSGSILFLYFFFL